MSYIFYIVLGYLSGSVLYSYLLPKYLCHIDVRKNSKDGNPGAFNAFSCCGAVVGSLSVFLDIAKGFFPVFLATNQVSISYLPFALIMIAPVMGHAWPIGQSSKGGKAIAVSFGALLGLFPDIKPVLLLAAFYLLFSLLLIISSHRLRSILAYTCFGICSLFLKECTAIKLGCLGIASIVCFRHFMRKDNPMEKTSA